MTDVWAYTTGELDTVGSLYDSNGTLLLFNDDGYFREYVHSFSLRRTVEPGVYCVSLSAIAQKPAITCSTPRRRLNRATR